MANGLARGAFVVSVELVPPRGFRADALVEQRAPAADPRGRPGEHPGRPARRRAHERAVGGGAGPAAGGRRDDSSLRLPRSEPARHAVGSPGRALDGRAQRAAHHRRSAAGRRLSGRDRRLRRRLDRPDQHGHAPQSRTRHRRAGHRRSRRRSTSAWRRIPAALDPDEELRRFEYKVKAGAEFAITQPVFDAAELARFLRRIEDFRIPVLAAIAPLESLRHTEFMANEVPGVRVPEAVVERMRRADAKGRAAAEGWRLRARLPPTSVRWCRVFRFQPRANRLKARLASWGRCGLVMEVDVTWMLRLPPPMYTDMSKTVSSTLHAASSRYATCRHSWSFPRVTTCWGLMPLFDRKVDSRG